MRRILFLALIATVTGHAFAEPKSARVTYLSGDVVYVDAGRNSGIVVGDTLRVLRSKGVVARLRVTDVAAGSAACATLHASSPLEPGDVVLFSAAFPNAPIEEPAIAPTPGPYEAARASQRVRGRVGARWLLIRTNEDPGVTGTDLVQPSLDLRLDGVNLLDGRFDTNVDVRSRRTTRTIGDDSETESRSRVYRASFAWHDRALRRRLSIGRQTAAALSTISLFDGILVETRSGGRSIGMFAGTEPEPERLGFSNDLVEGGAFATFQRRDAGPSRWSVTVGAATSYEKGSPNRDFLFMQGSAQSPHLATFFTQEVDFNRAWKRALGERRVSWTSTYVTLRAPINSWSAVQAGYDSRRNVLLYRDRTTPETEFDDRYRQGTWVGASFEPSRRLRLSTDVRTRAGGGRSRATTWSGTASVHRLTAWNGRARVRLSHFSDEERASDLLSAGFGCDVLAFVHAELGGGWRRNEDLEAPRSPDETETWIDLDLDVTLRHWFLNWSTERSTSDTGTVWQQTGGISWRF